MTERVGIVSEVGKVNDADVVSDLLATAGFEPPEDEVAKLVAVYPMIREMVGLLYTVEAARYESPALIFDPDPTFTGWR
jgi:hypothetical protein